MVGAGGDAAAEDEDKHHRVPHVCTHREPPFLPRQGGGVSRRSSRDEGGGSDDYDEALPPTGDGQMAAKDANLAGHRTGEVYTEMRPPP